MNNLKKLAITWMLPQLLCCCTIRPGLNYEEPSGIYTVYVMSRGIHTGLVIPVNPISRSRITALEFFEKAPYVDFGWGEEVVYQARNETFCMDLKAVAVPSGSVMCAEAVNSDIDFMVGRSDYAVEFRLNEDEFVKLCLSIDKSFTRDPDNRLIKTSVRSGGAVIYFRSVHTYCLFNTCNTWIAEELSHVVPGISSCMVITRGGLYDRIKERGKVLKSSQ